MNEPIEVETRAVATREDDLKPIVHNSLFGTSDPVKVVENAAKVASALKEVVRKQNLISNISGKEYPRCEAWTLLGTMLGIFPVLSWSKPVEGGWEARVEAKTMSGTTVGAAEAQCLKTERNWASRDDFAVRSMAQTRATAKALRMPLGFIMTLAGYEATPAEEMIHDEPKNANTRGIGVRNAPVPRISTSPEVPQTPPKVTTGNREWLMKEIGENTQYATEYCRKSGMLLPTENLEQLPDRFIPLNQEQMDLWFGCLDAFVEGSEAKKPFVNDVPEPRKRPAYVQPEQKKLPTGPGSWRSFPVLFGKNAGKPLGKLEASSLNWYIQNFKVTPTFQGKDGKVKQKSPEALIKDKEFRKALDSAQFELGIEDRVPM